MPFLPQSVLAFYHEQLRAKDARIAELERQVDEQHRQGVPVLSPPPAPERPLTPIGAALRAALDGIEDPESRAQYEAVARSRLAAGEDQEHVARTLFRA